ncbi:MAG: radical SAM protein [Thaumarchaeota archaeon]|jgi:radical SAM superfamily enzyme YgiQ (UPF0313 family)|nr:MAG: radical SAM protein [Nitrososphaerota archaeon]
MPFSIYLGDLTYDTISLATEAFPLNVGYIAAYCKKKFDDQVQIKIFKYIDEIEDAISESPPDVLGLSNYAWNHRISSEIFKLALKKNPNTITVWGGPNLPTDIISQKEFLQKFSHIDVYVPIEGEIGFSNIVENILDISPTQRRRKIFEQQIGNCMIYKNNELIFGDIVPRITELDSIPSPYLTGLMDKFFDGKLSPMLQTNRGCPFRCTYCVDGSAEVNKVNQFSLERINQELEYMGTHVPNTTKSMIISDLNFGMMPKDSEICNIISRVQEKNDFPLQVHATTGKNSKKRIIDAISTTNGALQLWISVQSLNPETLKNVRRENISVSQMLELVPAIKEANLTTASEVILGLPGDTYQTTIDTFRGLMNAKIEDIQVYTCMMLNGSEMNSIKEREKWNFKTKFRVLPKDFVKLKNGKNIVEIEEVIIENNTLSFEEYVKLRTIAFSLFVTNIGIVYHPLLKFLSENNIERFELINETVENLQFAPISLRNVFKSFKKETIDELWDTPEQIEKNYQNDEEFQKLLNEDNGMNVLMHHHALVVNYHMDDWTNYITSIAENLLKFKLSSNKVKEQFEDIKKYCFGLSHNVLNSDRMDDNPEFIFNYDIKKWDANDEEILSNCRNISPVKLKFIVSEKQNQLIEDKLNIFGRSLEGILQTIKRIPRKNLWRTPIPVNHI